MIAPDFVVLYSQIQPERLACVDLATGRRWSYRALDAAVAGTAAALRQRHGLAAGERLATIARNSADLVILHLACLRAGVVFVPLNWRLAPSELAAMLEDCDAKLVAYDAASSTLADQLPDWERAEIAGVVSAEPDVRHGHDRAAKRDAAQPAVLLYTSGTSGRPKAAVLTAGNIFHSACNFTAVGHVSPDSVFLCESPMFHVIGLIPSLHAPLMHGATVLMSGGFEPERTIGYIADRSLGVTHYFCVPQMASRIRENAAFAPAKFSGLVAMFTGGAPCPPADIRAWIDDGIPMVVGYGMTEAGTVLGMPIACDRIREKIGASGVAAPTVEVRIVDAAGKDVATGEAGEIWLRGPNITSGYWNREEETRAAFSGDGWLRTGDIGRMDLEGFVSIVDRKKDMFISGGENVYASEIERRLLEHPAVAEAAVIGRPDAKWGEVGFAYLVARPGISPPKDDALAAFCAEDLARYKIPKRFIWLGELPRTASGKIRKDQLRGRAAS